jgi:hypothetical protein
MTEKVVRHIEPFVNQFGDTINPGDAVYAITVCTQRTHVAKGNYLGVIKRAGWRGNEERYVQVLVDAKRTEMRWADTDEPTNWNQYWNSGTTNDTRRAVKYVPVPYKRVSTLQLNRIVPAGISADALAASI